MSQHDLNIANQTPISFRADLNSALSALASNSAGDSPPNTTSPNMFWYDSVSSLLNIRNESDDDWITLGKINQGSGVFQPYINNKVIEDFLNEGGLSSNSSTSVPSQQSVKSYVDTKVGSIVSEQIFVPETNVSDGYDPRLGATTIRLAHLTLPEGFYRVTLKVWIRFPNSGSGSSYRTGNWEIRHVRSGDTTVMRNGTNTLDGTLIEFNQEDALRFFSGDDYFEVYEEGTNDSDHSRTTYGFSFSAQGPFLNTTYISL